MNQDTRTNVIAGRYALGPEIASGGMATVHLARQLGAGGFARVVAIKRLRPEVAGDPEFVAMLLDEARLVARVRHPNVVLTLDVVSAVRDTFVVMEYVHGESLHVLLQTSTRLGMVMPARIAIAIAIGLLRGLHAAHVATSEDGTPLCIVHRDVSPQNVLIGIDGLPRVIDFGVAKALARSQATRPGQLKGKLAYMAPEQVSGGDVDARADLFAASVVLWECLTGKRLFAGDSDGEIIGRLLSQPIPPPSRFAGVPSELDAIVMRGLDRDPTRRFANAEEMAQALDRLGPAALSEVSAWIREIGAESLARRDAAISSIESTPGAEDERATRRDLLGSAPTVMAAMIGSRPRPEPAVTRPRMLIGIAIAAVLGAAAIGGGVAFQQRDRDRPAPAAISATTSVAPAAAPPAPPAACPGGMVRIGGGPFFMGADDGTDAERPAHRVTVTTFCIDVNEVSVGAYLACGERGDCKRAPTTNAWPGINAKDSATYDALCNARDPVARKYHPINCVSWNDAARYCAATGKRLPTEAEWEFAARGSEGRTYPWGDDAPTVARLNACGAECQAWSKKAKAGIAGALFAVEDGWASTAPVGSFPAGRSRTGLEDMAGNVFEWVADRFAPYSAEDVTDPSGPPEGGERVIRGGAWNSVEASWVRASYRFKSGPETRTHGIGFRCASSL